MTATALGITVTAGDTIVNGENDDGTLPTYSIAKANDIIVTYSLKDPNWHAVDNPNGMILIDGNMFSGASTDGKSYKFLGTDIAAAAFLFDGGVYDIEFNHMAETPIHGSFRWMENATLRFEAAP